jgi:hypothetical protein
VLKAGKSGLFNDFLLLTEITSQFLTPPFTRPLKLTHMPPGHKNIGLGNAYNIINGKKESTLTGASSIKS